MARDRGTAAVAAVATAVCDDVVDLLGPGGTGYDAVPTATLALRVLGSASSLSEVKCNRGHLMETSRTYDSSSSFPAHPPARAGNVTACRASPDLN